MVYKLIKKVYKNKLIIQIYRKTKKSLQNEDKY